MSEVAAPELSADKPARKARPKGPLTVSIEPLCVDLETAAAMTSLSESTIQKMQARGEFPMPRELSPRRCAYLVSELKEWVAARPHSQVLPPPSGSN